MASHPSAVSGKKDKQAKDLGSSQRAIGVASGTRHAQLAVASKKSAKVRTLRCGPRSKKLISKASVHAGALYGCELDPLTINNITKLRTSTAVALSCEERPK